MGAQDNGLEEAADELQVPLHTVCYLAMRAHDLMGKSESTVDEDGAEEDDPELGIREDRGTDAVEAELRSLLDDLDEEALIDLVALVWLGRDGESWDALRELARQEHNASTADYLLGTPLLADYLLEGLDRLGLDCRGDMEPG
ncbi:DUF3775 domain-containing protein [Poseidonocella sp. HB161398]|uniref:DUF3775 domain-containing protein n=1 Tax=Poseidonocella sp. HB161398 TaxID=2320855 RepID=UPI0014863683|nr:DUF3775 domain-containing protein [Poseidonocella sp. HB161398]